MMMKRILLLLIPLLMPVNGSEDVCPLQTSERSVYMKFEGSPENLTAVQKTYFEDAFQTTYNRLGEDLCGGGSLRYLDTVEIIDQPQRRLQSVRRRAYTFTPFVMIFRIRYKCRGCNTRDGLFGNDASRRSLAQETSGSDQERSLDVSPCASCEMITPELFITDYNSVLKQIADDAGDVWVSDQTAESMLELEESLSHSVCDNFAVHAGTTITFDGVLTTIHGGDVGSGAKLTGNYQLQDGGEVVDDSSDFTASMVAAHGAAIAVHANERAMVGSAIGDMTFTPGIYRYDTTITIDSGTVVTLDGNYEPNPVFRFIAGSTLITSKETSFILKNGARAENVLWALGTAATLGDYSVLEGSILAGSAITVGTQTVLNGCAVALSAVTFESEGSIDLTHYI